MTQTPEDQLHFDIDASVVFQLGESLISDVTQALVELVKNSYDADATYVKVTIDTRGSIGDESAYPDSVGYVVIEDDGVGMSRSTIQDGWLTISNSPKRELKRQNKTTEKRNRTPLGDKGLGRLGSQRLGHNLEIFTTLDGSNVEYHVAFSWRDFSQTRTLSQVPLSDEKLTPPRRKKGTKIVISDLKDPEGFRGKGITRLEVDLSRMISPYKEVEDFILIASIDGRALNLAEITTQIRQVAQINYHIDFDGTYFSIKGKTRFSYIKANAEEPGAQLNLLDIEDDREQFFKFLTQQKKAERFNLTRSEEEGWFVEYESKRKFSDFDSLSFVPEGIEAANPGPFQGEIDYFDLSSTSAAKQSIFTTTPEYRRYIKDLSGIRVYRDGFGVRVDRDWLGLGRQQTSGGSYYGLRPENTLGYIAISAKYNASLEETTDRQDLILTPHYENFYELLQYFVRFSADAQEFLRREWSKFQKQKDRDHLTEENVSTPEEQLKKTQEYLSKAPAQREALSKVRISLKQTIKETQQAVERLETAVPKDSPEYKDVQAIKNIIEKRIGTDLQTPINQMDTYLSESLQSRQNTERIANQIEIMKDQIGQVYEMVSLGLTAEVLSHEIDNAMMQLTSQTRDALNYLKTQKIRDERITSFVRYVNTTISSLNKQLSHLAPSLRYVREKKEKISLIDYLQEIRGYYKHRFERLKIRVELEYDENFSVSINKGKLTQIIDNLFLNSEYWLCEDIRLGQISEGVITVKLLKPFVRISDNGRGVEPTIETSLFEPFTTLKGREKGRGLGLFIIQELLKVEGCSISLLPIRNKSDRNFIFEIDFTGVLVGDA